MIFVTAPDQTILGNKYIKKTKLISHDTKNFIEKKKTGNP